MSAVVPRRVLVTGAGGNIGRVVCERVAGHGAAVTALVLDASQARGLVADRVVVGDAGDPIVVAEALRDADAVAHLAALPSPELGTPHEVFSGNTRATFTVLDLAGAARVRRIMIAGSLSVLGLAWSQHALHPAYLPVDERTPLQVEDAYALSKQVDECTARMIVRRDATTIVSLRLPFVAWGSRARDRMAELTRDPLLGAGDLWAYLDVRDAAEAVWQSLTAPGIRGFHSVFVAAPRTLSPEPTAELVARFHPGSTLTRPLVGREVPIALHAVHGLWPFTVEHLTEPEEN